MKTLSPTLRLDGVLWQLHPTLPPSSSSSADWSLSKLFSRQSLLSCSHFYRLPSCSVSHLAASSSSKTELLIFSWSQPSTPLTSLESVLLGVTPSVFFISPVFCPQHWTTRCSLSFLLTWWISGSALPWVISHLIDLISTLIHSYIFT